MSVRLCVINVSGVLRCVTRNVLGELYIGTGDLESSPGWPSRLKRMLASSIAR